jgi:hypothetical protein
MEAVVMKGTQRQAVAARGMEFFLQKAEKISALFSSS